MMIALVSASVLQLLLPAYRFFGQTKFPFLLAVVLYYSLNRERGVACIAALVAGIMQDSLSMIPLGYSSACFLFLAWVVSRFRSVMVLESMFTPVLFGAVSLPAMILCLYVLLRYSGRADPGALWIVLKLSGGAALGAVVTPVVFCIMRGLDAWVGNVEKGGLAA
jgi:rod shape-determining protein MreD